jgi:hypothetical protein
MADQLQFSYDANLRAHQIGFAAGWELRSAEDLALFSSELTRRCEGLKQRVHYFFDLTNLRVAAEFVEQFGEAKRGLCAQYALSTWHFGGSLAERVMTRNDLTRRGLRPNLFRNRSEALAAFLNGESNLERT